VEKKNNGAEVEDTQKTKEQQEVSIEKKPKKKPRKTRIKELEAQLDQMKTEHERLKDQLLRTMANFDNYQKAQNKDFVRLRENMEKEIKYVKADLIKELLPIIDDFERFLDASSSGDADSALHSGIELIYSNFITLLNNRGLKVIESSVGKPFNANYHEAVIQKTDEEKPPGIVLEEFQKGYIFQDIVIRPAKVTVNHNEG